MLWDVIRDFFVQYVFGGLDSSDNAYSVTLGDLGGGETFNEELCFRIGLGSNGSVQRLINISDWLSTTATIISLVIIVYLCCMLIKQIYNICAHVIG